MCHSKCECCQHCAKRWVHALQLRRAKENKNRLVPNDSFYQNSRWPLGNLENPNCVLSKTATAWAIILSLLNLSLSVCMCFCICVHTCVSMPVCVWVCVSSLPWKPSEPQGAVKNQYSSAALPLYSFNNSLPLHYCSTDLPSQGPDWHLCALLPHWSLM